MKNIFFASLVAVLGLGVQSFAQDDEYGQDQDQVEYAEKTASYDTEEDDGYGNPVQPQEEPAAVRTETQTQSSNSSSGNPFFDKAFNLAWRLGIGFDGLHDTPATEEYSKYGVKDNPNDGWAGANVELGLFSLIHINPMFSIAPEFQFTFRFLSQTQDEFPTWRYGYVTKELNLYMFDIDIPVTVRFNPVHFFYVEAGAQLAFNLGSGSDITWSDSEGQTIASDDTETSWSSASMFVSLVFGLGATFEMHNKNYDVGLRVVYDLTNLHKETKDYIELSATETATVENNSKVWAVQLVIGYWFL